MIETLVDSEKKSDSKYKTLFEGINDAVFIMPSLKEGFANFIDVNEVACKRLGYTKEELLKLSPSKISASEDVKLQGSKKYREELHQNRYSIFEATHVTKTGERIPVEISSRVLNSKGETFVMSLARDITKRKHAENVLQYETSSLMNILNSIPDGIYIVSKIFDIEYINPVIEREFGAINGRKCHEYFHDLKEPCTWCKNDEVYKGKTVRWEWHSTKSNKDYDLLDFPFKNADGTISKFEIFHDITEIKKAERALKESEERYNRLSDLTHEGILIHKDEIVLDINKTFERLSGYTSEEIIGKNALQLFIPQKYYSTLNSMMNKTIATTVEIEGINKNGAIVPLEIESREITYGDNQKNARVSVIRDITDRKRAEEEKMQLEMQLRHQQKLESIGTLAGGVAHEINNPINGIINYAQLIKDKHENDETVNEYSSEIIRESERVVSIVRNLLTFSRDDVGTHSPARITDIVNSTVSLISTVFKHDQIKLDIEIPENIPDLKCGSQQIRQVIMNLMTNARDALNEKFKGYNERKVMSLSVSQFEKEDRRWMRIIVEDEGNGISEEIENKIFDPFFTTKDRATGTGLGLSISYGIVKDHHGKLYFESAVGKYTRFYLELPIDNGWSVDEEKENGDK